MKASVTRLPALLSRVRTPSLETSSSTSLVATTVVAKPSRQASSGVSMAATMSASFATAPVKPAASAASSAGTTGRG